MMLAVLFAIVGSPLMPTTHEYQVDCIEINHVFDQKGGLVLTQAILWRIEASDGRLHNYGWKLLRADEDWPWCLGGLIRVRHFTSRGVVMISAPCCRVRSTRDDMERLDTQEFWHGKAPNLFSCEVVE
jgi:hypothetical protein